MNRNVFLLMFWLCCGNAGVALAAEDVEFFESRIRPVLVKHCYECHSSASDEPKGGLLLDSRAGLRKGGESGVALNVGKPQTSLLIESLKYESFEMPPSGKLPEQVISDFEKWIRDGAVDSRLKAPSATEAAQESWEAQLAERSRWWSLQPPQIVELPNLDNETWAKNRVDPFILSKLSQEGLKPAEPATAEVLLRRLSFVLTGLPPKPEKVQVFVEEFSENADQAIEKLVDELLDSPHFGERFARHWMDVVRYTDTYGYEWDIPAKGSWEYRDYLIRAFNNDIGFDQLIREQIAGDLLLEPRIDAKAGFIESMIGPMFYHLGEHRHGSSLAFNGIHQEMINNKIDAFSKAFLGMTVACARCHDHKLDAISQADYYALAGVFMTPRWTARSIDAPGKHDKQIAELRRLRDEIQQQMIEVWRTKAGALASAAALRNWAYENRSSLQSAKVDDISWPLSQLLNQTIWLETGDLSATASTKTTELLLEDDGTVLAQGAIPATDSYTVKFTTGPGTSDRLRLEALTHESLGSRGPGRTPHGNFVLTNVHVEVQPKPAMNVTGAAVKEVVLASAQSDYSQPNYPVEAVLDSSSKTGWGIGLGGNVDRTAEFIFAEPIELPNGGTWTVTLKFEYGTNHILGRFRLTPGFETASSLTESELHESNQAVAESWERISAQWRSTSESSRQSNSANFTLMTDFSEPGFPIDWVVEGDGIKHGYVTDGTPIISLEGEQVISRLLPRGYHTHALSSKLPGAIRPPEPKRFPRTRVSLQLAGGEWAGRRAIPQNAFLNEGPLFFNPSTPPTWTSFTAVGLTNGVTRVLTEITTSSLNSNFPPRTGVANAGGVRLPDKDEGQDKRSWFSVTGVVAHDAGGVPLGELDEFASLYGRADLQSGVPTSADAAWQRLADWLTSSVDRWRNGEVIPGDVKVMNWLLEQNLLSNDLKAAPDIGDLVKRYREVESSIAFSRTANSMDERSVKPVNYRLNLRGNVDDEGPAIPRSFLEVFKGEHQVDSSSQSGRLELANYLSSRDNPQTARVFVNRVWQWIFGTGIVATPSDFGKLGDRPSHPELLDWLAIQFMEDDWSTKKLIKQIVISQTFRQSGSVSDTGSQRDPENRLLHHFPTRRLEGEAIRDNLLSVSGQLDRTLYGPPINPPRTTEDSKKRLFSGPLASHGRRSLYIEMSIMEPPKFLVGFNLPDLKLPTGRRDVTNVPAQALIMLNDPLVVQMAERWAHQLVNDDSFNVEQRIERMFLQAFGRTPNELELKRWSSAIEGFAQSQNFMGDKEAWAELAHALFNTKEFIYYR